MRLITRTVEESQSHINLACTPGLFPLLTGTVYCTHGLFCRTIRLSTLYGNTQTQNQKTPLWECTTDCSREHPNCSIEHFKFMCWKTLTYQPNHPTPYLNLSQDNTNPPLVHQASSPFWITRFLPIYHSNPSSFKNYISQFLILYSSLAGMV